jgi:hypothetical protein
LTSPHDTGACFTCQMKVDDLLGPCPRSRAARRATPTPRGGRAHRPARRVMRPPSGLRAPVVLPRAAGALVAGAQSLCPVPRYSARSPSKPHLAGTPAGPRRLPGIRCRDRSGQRAAEEGGPGRERSGPGRRHPAPRRCLLPESAHPGSYTLLLSRATLHAPYSGRPVAIIRKDRDMGVATLVAPVAVQLRNQQRPNSAGTEADPDARAEREVAGESWPPAGSGGARGAGGR